MKKKKFKMTKYLSSKEGKRNVDRHIALAVIWIGCPIIYSLYWRHIPYEMERFLIGVFITLIGFILGLKSNRELKKIINNNERRLVINGMFSICRHPFYLSQSILTIGMVIMFPSIASVSIMIVFFILTRITINVEERNMEKIFGKKYTRYKKKTPMFTMKLWNLFTS